MFHLSLKTFQILVWGFCTHAVRGSFLDPLALLRLKTVSFKYFKHSINSGRVDSTGTEPYGVFMLPFRLWHVLDYCRRDTWRFLSILTLYGCQTIVGYIVVLTSALLMNFAACHPTFQSPPSSLLKSTRTEERRDDFQHSYEWALQRTRSTRANRRINNFMREKNLPRHGRKCARVCVCREAAVGILCLHLGRCV